MALVTISSDLGLFACYLPGGKLRLEILPDKQQVLVRIDFE